MTCAERSNKCSNIVAVLLMLSAFMMTCVTVCLFRALPDSFIKTPLTLCEGKKINL